MQSKERIWAAIRHEKADRIPRGEIVVDDAVVRSFLGCTQVGFAERFEFVQSIGLDLFCQGPAFPGQPAGDVLPQPAQAGWGDLDDWVSRTDRFIFITLDGVFGWGTRLWGFQRFAVSLMRGSSDLTVFIRAVEELNLELAQRAQDRGVMGVLFADDLAYQRGLMAGPERLRRYILPSLARQTEALTALGLPVFFHSDGNLNDILEDLADIGLTGLQGLEAAAGMDLGLIKERYGARLCLWGNLDPACLVLPHSREEIAGQIDSILKVASQAGGFIFGTSSGLFKGVKPENMQWVYETLESSLK